MDELFRFYAIRAPQPLPEDTVIALDAPSAFQENVRTTMSKSPERARSLANDYVQNHGTPLSCLGTSSTGTNIRTFMAWAANPAPQEVESYDASFRAKFREIFQQDPAAVRSQEDRNGTPTTVKDGIVALRVLNPSSEALRTLLRGGDPTAVVNGLVSYARFYKILEMEGRPFESRKVAMALKAKLTTGFVDLPKGAYVPPPPPGPTLAEQIAEAATALADLTRLLRAIERSCPSELAPPVARYIPPPGGGGETVIVGVGNPSLLGTKQSSLEHEFSGLPARIETALGTGITPPATGWLAGGWRDVYLRYETKARALQSLIDRLVAQAANTPTPPAPASNQAPTPLAGGYMRMAGMTDVKVVRSHVVRYEGAEIAQIENVLQGETRSRRFRSLTRSEENQQSQTEKQVTEEKELKTEDQSSLKSSVDQTLKDNLDFKVGFDLKAKIGDSVQIGLNTSFGYSRSSEETKKASSDFAKNVTNRAARKVAETVKTTIETRLLRETEETIDHTFDAKGETDNIVGLYQWIEKVMRVQVFNVGDEKRSVLDGVVLQPGQRLLGNPAQIGLPTAVIPAPPEFDVTPNDIHPWNYLSLAAKFGATTLSAPPPLTQNVSFSSAGPQGQGDAGKLSHFAVAQDIVLPEGVAAAYASVTLSATMHEDFDQEHAIAVLGGQRWLTAGSAANERLKTHDGHDREILQNGTQLLAGERMALPFTFFGGYVTGYAVAVDVTCARTQEAYEEWQMAIHSALRAAHASAKQAYDETSARASLERAYDLGPSPGKVDQILRDEIKRQVISILAKQSGSSSFYDEIDGYYQSAAYAEIAQRCLFFEHALEWENMTYILYPYFWADGRDDGWAKHLERAEKDDDLVAFLKAGAARVVVPIRPIPKDIRDEAKKSNTIIQGFSDYLKEMSLPSLPELIDVGSPIQLAIEEELKARDGATPETWDDEWEIRVPTELVRLMPKHVTPEWSEATDATGKVLKGNWIETDKTTP